MKYSVVVPVFDEEGNVENLHRDIVSVMAELHEPYQVIFIDDGSADRTVEILHGLSPIVVIELRKNFGQTAAMDAGIKASTGEIIITLDGDGQNPPSEIPKVLKKMEEGDYDVVSGWRKKRKDTFAKRFVSRGANMLRSVLVKDGIQDSGCSLKAYKRYCFEGVDLHGEMHRFIPAVLSWSGYTIGEVEVEHRPRTAGVSKYSWKRTVKGLIDMLGVGFYRKYASRPLHLFGGLGFLLSGFGTLIGLFLFVKRVIFGASITSSSLPLLAVLLIVLGVQLFISGLLADISVRNYYRGKDTPYSIKKTTKR